MRKIFTLLSTMLLLFAFSSKAVNVTGCYLIGEINGQEWGYNIGTKLDAVEGSTNVFAGEVTFDRNGNFAVATSLNAADWNEFNDSSKGFRYGPKSNGKNVSEGVKAEMGANGDTSWHLMTVGSYNVVVDFNEGTILIGEEKAKGSGLYLLGDVTKWETFPNYEFVKESETVYSLSNVKLQGFFLISAPALNMTAGGTTDEGDIVALGAAHELTLKSNKPLALDKTYMCSKITLSLQNGKPMITIEGTETTSGIYVMCPQNSWSANPEWEMVDNGRGVYVLEGKNPIAAEEDQFKIASADWSTYNLGLAGGGTNPIELNTDVALAAGSQSNIAFATGAEVKSIKCTINATGATLFVSTESSSVADVEIEKISVVASEGHISVKGEFDAVRVFSVNGMLVSEDAESDLTQGIYVVKVDDSVQKVVVR